MNKTYKILLLFGISVSVNAMDNEWWNLDDQTLDQRQLEGSSLLEMKQVYETAPPFIKGTVEHLKDPNYYKPNGAPEYRFLMLHGESGSGKSTLAKAISMYAGWDLEFTCPADYQVGNRGEAAIKLRNKIQEIILRNAPTVLVIDEINQLLENSEQAKTHDNDATSKELWTTMDRINGNNKFFIIGTANRLYKVPKQIKTRIKGRYCNINMPKDSESRLKIFNNILSRTQLVLNNESTENMKTILNRYPKWSGRDFSEFCWKIKQKLNDEWKVPNITKGTFIESKMLDEVENTMNDAEEEDLQYDHEELTEEDRQDLYQAQNMWLQLCMQRFQKNTMMGFRTNGLKADDGNYIIDNTMTPNQVRLSKKLLNHEKLRERHF